MSFVQNFPFFSIILGLVCAVVSFVLPHRLCRPISIGFLSASVCMQSAVLYLCASNNLCYTYMMGHYPAPWGNEIISGVLEPLMALVFSVAMLLSVLGGSRHIALDVRENSQALYWVMVDLTLVSLLALCYTNDIFTGYVFIEICTIASCALIASRNNGRALIASIRYMVFALVGSGLFLIGVIFTYSITGHLLFPQLHSTISALWKAETYHFSMTTAIALMTVGLGIKSGLFPFHIWMPDTYGRSTPASASILSGVVSKGYTFLLIKIIYRAVGTQVFYATGVQNILLAMGIGGMIVCSMFAIRTRHLTGMVAYSSAAQMGYIFMGIGMGTDAGMLATILQILNHAITKPMLFLSSAQLSDASGRRMDFQRLRGAGHRNPAAGVSFTIGALSMVGMPILSGFIPKLYFARDAFTLSWQTWPILLGLCISTVLNVLYFLYTAVLIWLPQEENSPYGRARIYLGECVPCFIFAALNLFVGLCPGIMVNLVRQGLTLLH